MDAFAENQMGRNDEANNSMLDVTQAAAIQAKRLRRSSKEQEMDAVAVEVSEELLAPSSAGADDDNDDPMEDVDMPTMSMDESAVIARKWERRKSRFMPVADPYGEPDEKVASRTRLLINAYCTCASLGSAAKRLLFESYVVCLPGTDFGDVGEGHLRFSYVRSMESLEEGMAAVHAFVEKVLAEAA